MDISILPWLLPPDNLACRTLSPKVIVMWELFHRTLPPALSPDHVYVMFVRGGLFWDQLKFYDESAALLWSYGAFEIRSQYCL